ncbi:IPT/TIG domain-containing protein, partial [Pseudomonas viridiflava]|uniref:IPT/TIG domain-containing protein n=1 Tax=Pseudomonas viridiflava TaxID=33069 RepID=UPI0013DF080F
LSGDLRDQQGKTLGADYRFGFVSDDQLQPELVSISPRQASWRGGTEISLRGHDFSTSATIEVGGQRVAAGDILYRDDSLIRFRLPGLLASPD